MNEIELYVHSPNDAEPKLIRVAPTATVENLLGKIHEAGLCDGATEHLHLFAEDGQEPLKPGDSIEHWGVKHRDHVHCHKCHRIQVVVTYNGVDRASAFPPSVKVKRVLRWAIDAFGLKGVDAENKVLRLAQPPLTELGNDAHIGSFADSAKCELRVCLVPPVRFQG